MVSFVMFCFESTVLEDWHIDASLVHLRISETDYSLLLQFSSHILRGSSETFSAMQIRYLRSEIFLRTGYYSSSCVLLMVQCRNVCIYNFLYFQAMIVRGFRGDSHSHKIFLSADTSDSLNNCFSLLCLLGVTGATMVSKNLIF